MKLELNIVGLDSNIDPKDRKSVLVETHIMRGETFIVQKSQTVMQGDKTVLEAPAGARLVILMPQEANEVVMDTAQNAAIKPAQQENNAGRADKPVEGVQKTAEQSAAQPPQARPNPVQQPVPQQPQPRVQTQQQPQPAFVPPERKFAPPPPPPPRAPAQGSAIPGAVDSNQVKGAGETKPTGVSTAEKKQN